MILALSAAVAAGIALPHVVRLDRAAPATAAALWLSSLGLRAVTGVFVAIYLVFFFPTTAFFQAMTHWCLHAIIPLLAGHLGLQGHALGPAVTVLPAVLLGGSASIAFGLARAGRSVRRLVARETLGPGPQGSIIVGGAEVVLAAAGLGRPRVVVSAGALTQLDEAELAAGLEHERGHIARRHRWVLIAGELCRGLGRFVPGSLHAKRQLVFHLERDADAWAMRGHDRVALASAICKAALSQRTASTAYALLGGGDDVTRRLDELIDTPPRLAGVRAGALRTAAVLSAVLVIGLAAAAPAAIAAGHARLDAAPQRVEHCS